MRPTLISFRRRLCRSLVGFVIAILTAHGPVETALSTFTAVAVRQRQVAAHAPDPVRVAGIPPGGLQHTYAVTRGQLWDRRPSVSGGGTGATTSRPIAPAVHGACPGATRPSPASPRARRSTPSVSGRSSPRFTRVGLDWVAGAVGWAEASRSGVGHKGCTRGLVRRSGWSPPSSAGRALPQFGMWDAMFVWYLLNTLSQPGHADFFHHHA